MSDLLVYGFLSRDGYGRSPLNETESAKASACIERECIDMNTGLDHFSCIMKKMPTESSVDEVCRRTLSHLYDAWKEMLEKMLRIGIIQLSSESGITSVEQFPLMKAFGGFIRSTNNKKADFQCREFFAHLLSMLRSIGDILADLYPDEEPFGFSGFRMIIKDTEFEHCPSTQYTKRVIVYNRAIVVQTRKVMTAEEMENFVRQFGDEPNKVALASAINALKLGGTMNTEELSKQLSNYSKMMNISSWRITSKVNDRRIGFGPGFDKFVDVFLELINGKTGTPKEAMNTVHIFVFMLISLFDFGRNHGSANLIERTHLHSDVRGLVTEFVRHCRDEESFRHFMEVERLALNPIAVLFLIDLLANFDEMKGDNGWMIFDTEYGNNTFGSAFPIIKLLVSKQPIPFLHLPAPTNAAERYESCRAIMQALMTNIHETADAYDPHSLNMALLAGARLFIPRGLTARDITENNILLLKNVIDAVCFIEGDDFTYEDLRRHLLTVLTGGTGDYSALCSLYERSIFCSSTK